MEGPLDFWNGYSDTGGMSGRPRKFLEQEALHRVMQTFWRSGFEGASFDRLVAETGLSRSSLYNAFGSKEDLFEKSMELYVREEMGPFLDSLCQEEVGSERLAEFIESWRQPYDSEKHRCLFGSLVLGNAASEGSPRHLGIVRRSLNRMWSSFATLMSKGRGKRAVAANATKLTDEEAAAILVALQFGVMLIARNGRNKKVVDSVADGAKKLFDV